MVSDQLMLAHFVSAKFVFLKRSTFRPLLEVIGWHRTSHSATEETNASHSVTDVRRFLFFGHRLSPFPVVVWLSGNVVWRINEVTLRQAKLVLRWVTFLGYAVLVFN